MAGILQAKKAGYAMDMEGFWPGDKCQIIAVSKIGSPSTFSLQGQDLKIL
jgi:hypothetical protein